MKLLYLLLTLVRFLLVCSLYQEVRFTRVTNCTSSDLSVLKFKVCKISTAHELSIKLEVFKNITKATVKTISYVFIYSVNILYPFQTSAVLFKKNNGQFVLLEPFSKDWCTVVLQRDIGTRAFTYMVKKMNPKIVKPCPIYGRYESSIVFNLLMK